MFNLDTDIVHPLLPGRYQHKLTLQLYSNIIHFETRARLATRLKLRVREAMQSQITIICWWNFSSSAGSSVFPPLLLPFFLLCWSVNRSTRQIDFPPRRRWRRRRARMLRSRATVPSFFSSTGFTDRFSYFTLLLTWPNFDWPFRWLYAAGLVGGWLVQKKAFCRAGKL